MSQWYKLDTAAKLFPAVSGPHNSSVYRLSVVLHEEINGAVLQQAVDQISGRFPMLFVRLHDGVFWNYMDENDSCFWVREDTAPPCSAINPRENNGYMLRVLYHHKRISLECSHTLTDGGGAFEFIKSLAYYYLLLTGKEVEDEGLVIMAGDGASRDELEDSYHKYAVSQPVRPTVSRNAFRIRGTRLQPQGNHVTTGIVSAKALNALAKSQGATITSYLTAVLVLSILRAQPAGQNDRRPVVITVPVNLRKIFPSETLRNFFCCINLSYEQQENNELSDLIAAITAQLRQKTTKEHLQSVIAQNAALERNIASRFVPLFLKRFFISLGFALFSEKKKTMTLSNLGNIPVPSGMAEETDRFEVFSYTSRRNPMICAVCSVDDKLAISFTRNIVEPDIIRNFFCLLASEETLDVKVYSNEWGD